MMIQRMKSSLFNELLGGFPSEATVAGFILAAEVTEAGGLVVDGAAEVELLDDLEGSELEVLLDEFEEGFVSPAVLDGAVGFEMDGEGFSDTDGVGELDEDALAVSAGNEGLGDPAGGVGGRAIDLGGILAGEGTTTVGTPATVGIDDDLAAGETGVTLGTTDGEAAGGVQPVDGLVVDHVSGEGGLDDLFHEVSLDLVVGDVFVVLDGDEDNSDAEGLEEVLAVTGVEFVFDGDLGLGVGAGPREGVVTAAVGALLGEVAGEFVGEGHEGFSFVGGITEHHTLIAGTEVFVLLDVVGTEDGLVDFGGLLFDGNEEVAGLVVETLGGVVEADVLDGVTDDLLVVEDGLGGDFTEDHDHTGLEAGFAGDLGVGIFGEAGVEDGIRDLIGHLVGVTFSDVFGGEENLTNGHFFGYG